MSKSAPASPPNHSLPSLSHGPPPPKKHSDDMYIGTATGASGSGSRSVSGYGDLKRERTMDESAEVHSMSSKKMRMDGPP